MTSAKSDTNNMKLLDEDLSKVTPGFVNNYIEGLLNMSVQSDQSPFVSPRASEKNKILTMNDIASHTKKFQPPIPKDERIFLQWNNLNYFVPTNFDSNDLQAYADYEDEIKFNSRIRSDKLSMSLSSCGVRNEQIYSNPENGLPYQRVERRGPKMFKQVVSSAQGFVRPGEMVGIMGPSGSGKTSLLNNLSQRQSLSGGSYKSGSITINGRELNKEGDFGKVAAFVQQDDVLAEFLSVEELFAFACKIRLGFQGDEIKTRVDQVIEKLNLGECRSTIIGGPFVKGISGGERKRTSIGYELITNPALLLLDEPTSGLDSTNALRIMKLIKNEAKHRGISALATIHQPSSDLFYTFDRIILLSEGFTIYNGPPSGVENFYSTWGFKMPRFANPADKLSNIAAEPWSELSEGKPTTVDLAEAVRSKQLEYIQVSQEELDHINNDLKTNFTEEALKRQVSMWRQYILLVERGWTFVLRFPFAMTFLIFLAIFNSFLWASIFYNVDAQVFSRYNTNTNITITSNLMGLCFLVVMDMFVNMCFGQVVAIPKDFPVFKRERANMMFCTTSYYFAQVTVASMTFFWYPFWLTLCSIWFFGLDYMSFTGFCEWWGILTLMAFNGSSFGFMLGCSLPKFDVAQIVATLFILIFGMGAGFMINTADANILVKFITWISPMNYGCDLLFKRILEGRPQEVQDELLGFFNYTLSDAGCVFTLIAFWIAFTCVGWFSLTRYATT